MTNPTDLNPERNEDHRRWTQFNRETILIILFSICVITVTGNHFRSNTAIDISGQSESNMNAELSAIKDLANDRSAAINMRISEAIDRTNDKWSVSYKELSTDYRLAVMEIDAFNVALSKHDIKVDHSEHDHYSDTSTVNPRGHKGEGKP